MPGTVLPRTIPAKVPAPPLIQTLLKRAYAFKDRLDKTAGLTRDALANEVGINPSYLTRILNLLNLAPEIQQYILAMPPTVKSVPITESRIKRLARNEDHKFQMQEFEKLLTLNRPFAGPIRATLQPQLLPTHKLDSGLGKKVGSVPRLEVFYVR